MTVHAVGNPVQTNREPSLIYDSATGCGMITFEKKEQEMTIEYWPRYVVPESNPAVQIYNETPGELAYALGINGRNFKPKVFDSQATYRVRVGEPDKNLW